MQALFEQDRTFMTIGCVLYAMAFVPALVALIRKRVYSRCLFLLFLLAGFVFQSLGLYLRGAANHDLPVQNTFEVFQVIAWLAVAANFIVRQLFRLQLLNFFASGFALLCTAVSLCVPDWDRRVFVNASGNPWVDFHAGLAIASYAIFGVLALTSVMYLIQDRALSRRKNGNFSGRLPAIGQLEAVNTKLITLGVTLLTASMGMGALNMLQDASSVRGIKLAIACTVWIGYSIILVLRRRRHLVGRPFARACVTVFLYALCLLWPLTYRPPAHLLPAPETAPAAGQANGSLSRNDTATLRSTPRPAGVTNMTAAAGTEATGSIGAAASGTAGTEATVSHTAGIEVAVSHTAGIEAAVSHTAGIEAAVSRTAGIEVAGEAPLAVTAAQRDSNIFQPLAVSAGHAKRLSLSSPSASVNGS